MTLPLPKAALLLAFAATVPAQTNPAPTQPPPKPRPVPRPTGPLLNHNLIFLDPGHGGTDTGAHLPGNAVEKDVTFSFASRIRSLLAGNGLTVVLSRESDTPPPPSAEDDTEPAAAPLTPTSDQRAGTANHLRPVACVLLHATSSGTGVHIVTSPIPAPNTLDLPTVPSYAVPWESAQASFIPQSLRLANEIGLSVSRANLPVHLSHASVRPIDNLTCPAIAIEIAPLPTGATPVTDAVYQQRVAQAVASALLSWRTHADPPAPPPSLVPGPSIQPSPTGADR